jgi:pimeloyl-ACP methyl ester carboxylesterase
MSLRSLTNRVVTVIAVSAALFAGGAAVAPAAMAAERGQNPTSSNIGGSGSYRTSSANVSRFSAIGFGGGTIYYPTDATDGPYPAVAISPGFTATWSSLSWLGPRLASWGIVVIGIETNTLLDQPGQRGDQLLAALDYLTDRSSIRTRVDENRLGVAGHSMGGGGTLEALSERSSLRAGVPLAPWNLDTTWNEVDAPVMIVGGQADTIAPVATHSIPFYTTLGGDKGYVELSGGSHFFPQTPNANVSRAIVSWLKLNLDDDQRFAPFVCFNRSLSISDFRSRGVC